MKKKLLLVLMLIAAVVVMPRVYADDAKTIKPAVVTDITNSDTLVGDRPTNALVTADNGDVTITYENSEFKILGAGDSDTASEGRDPDNAWIGFRVTVPENATKYTLKRGEKEIASENVTANNTFDRYVGISVANLTKAASEGKDLVYAYDLTWEGEDATTLVQHITVIVKPASTTLVDPEKGEGDTEEEVWNNDSYEEARPVKVTVKVMKDGKEVEVEEPLSYELVKPAKLTEEQIAAIKAALTDEDVELVDLYADAELKNVFVVTDEIEEDVTIYVAYKTKEKAPVEEEKAPNTVDNGVMYIALAGASLLVASGVAVYFKKANE